jgi:ankyrin repeat protein
MSSSNLPERPSLEYLRKLAKERLQALRRANPDAKLAGAQLSIAREHGFPSWRALKAEVDRRAAPNESDFFAACSAGDVDTVRRLLANQPSLLRATKPGARHAGWTALHSSAQAGRAEVVRVLLQHGADANAREAGDNTSPLHWAAAAGNVESVRALLDAGSDVDGVGDLHEMGAIGWATEWREPGEGTHHVVTLLLERGARHHIFSAIAVGDVDLVRRVAAQPGALARRRSRFEESETPLHCAMSRGRLDLMDVLIQAGADVDAKDARGRTPLDVAMLRGDAESTQRLQTAGAKAPNAAAVPDFTARMTELARTIARGAPMIAVPDVAETLAWYASLGFEELGRYADDGVVNFGVIGFGKTKVMLRPGGQVGRHDVSLWFYTDQVDRVYELLKARQLEAARASLDGKRVSTRFEFTEDLYEPFYGGRQFTIRDLNGYEVVFAT